MRGPQRARRSSLVRRVAASVVAIAATSVVVGAGVRTASASISVDRGAPTVESVGTLDASGLLPGADVQRLLTVGVAGGLGNMLIVTAQTSSRLDADRRNGLQLAADSCSLPWTHAGGGYQCPGVLTSVIASRPVLGRAALHGLTAGTAHQLRLTLSLPSAGGTDMLGQRSALIYRIGT